MSINIVTADFRGMNVSCAFEDRGVAVKWFSTLREKDYIKNVSLESVEINDAKAFLEIMIEEESD